MSTRGGVGVLGTKKGRQQATAFIATRVEVPTVGFYGIASAIQRVLIGPLGVDCLVGLRASSAGISRNNPSTCTRLQYFVASCTALGGGIMHAYCFNINQSRLVQYIFSSISPEFIFQS